VGYVVINRLSSLDYNKQLIKLLIQAKVGTSVVNIIGPLIYFYVFFNTIPLNVLISWVLIQIIIFAFRMKVGFDLLKILDFKSTIAIKKHLSIYLIFIFINAVMWGISAIPALMYGTQFQIIILTIGIFAILSGSMLTLTHVFHAVFIYIIGVIPIFILALIIVGASQIYYLIALFLLMYSLGATSAAYMIHLYMNNSIEKNEEVVLLNRQLKQKVENAIQDTKLMERKLQEQSHLAQMGEMISMIAHQWRQPISTIAMGANNILVDIELDSIDKNSLTDRANDIVAKTVDLSKTIDDFRNFYKTNKQSVIKKLKDVIEKSLNIIKPSLVNHSINIIEEYNSDEEIELYDREVMQVILNILKNAQDNIKEKNIKKPYIKITTKDRTIYICDNSGGIPEDIIEKIFDPYFSTKDEKNGTGLGLYMSKTIIEKHHNGKISAQNTEDGVCFTIELGIISEK